MAPEKRHAHTVPSGRQVSATQLWQGEFMFIDDTIVPIHGMTVPKDGNNSVMLIEDRIAPIHDMTIPKDDIIVVIPGNLSSPKNRS